MGNPKNPKKTNKRQLSDSHDLYRAAYALLRNAPYKKPVAILAESVYDLRPASPSSTSSKIPVPHSA